MMVSFNDLPISRKVMRVNVIVGASLLLTASVAFISYQLVMFTQSAAEHLATAADIAGIDVTPAILFNDPRAATESLTALRASPNVEAAAVYTLDGRMFAKYARSAQEVSNLPESLSFAPSSHRIEGNGLIVARQIVSDGKPIGMLYARSDLQGIRQRLRGHAEIAVGVLAAAFALALVVSSKLERKIAGPIRSLAETARAIASKRDYSVRAEVRSKDETGVLAEAFNEMLRRIEEQSAELEARVAERTEKLTAANKELATANEAKDRFLATMSHELRTPLNAIIGFTGTLLMKLSGPLTSDQENQLKTVRTSGKHLLSLINDLLDLAKIQSGKVELKLEPVNCGSVVNDVATALGPLAQAKGLRFEVIMPEEDLVVPGDRRALSQIMINLTNNAIKFTHQGFVRIELKKLDTEPERIELSVTDSGAGIADADQKRLFQPFEQIHTSGGRTFEGTGLGLHLSQKLAALLGAEIVCRSEYGKGSRFSLALQESA
jgi:signal transduction histidine kinase/cell division protein FtsB